MNSNFTLFIQSNSSYRQTYFYNRQKFLKDNDGAFFLPKVLNNITYVSIF